MDCFALPAERVEAIMVEISGGEIEVPLGSEAPRTIIEALAGDVDIVAVEHSVDEPRGHVARCEPRRRRGCKIEKVQPVFGVVRRRIQPVQIAKTITDQSIDVLDLAQKGEALERPDSDVPMAEPRENRGAGRGGLVSALERFPRFEQCEALRRIDAQGLEHLRREHFANAALQRQPAIRVAAVGSLAGALGPKVKEAAAIVAQLRKREPASVADLRIVHPELVAVRAKRPPLIEVSS